MARAQNQPSQLPLENYYFVFEQFYEGEFRAAERNLKGLSRRGSIIIHNEQSTKFLDSVCYWTMLGESYYRRGQYALALEQYEAALALYMGLQEYISATRTTYPTNVQEDQGNTRRSKVPWAVSGRNPRYGSFNRTMLVRLGKSPQLNEQAARNGGVIDPERLQSVDISEIMRCAALAAYRRHQIKGPISLIDPFTSRLSTNLVGTGGTTYMGAWTGVVKGLALASKGDSVRATQLLRSSLQISGYDHPLTPVALLTLGKIAVDQGALGEAQKLFMEASIAGAAFEQYDMVEEALRYGALIHASGRTLKPYQPLVAAIEWAQSQRNKDTLQASLLTTAAMVAAESGETDAATKLLQDARRKIRKDLTASAINTNWLYVNAMVAYLKRDIKNGDKAFGEFRGAASNTSFWLFQIALADNAVKDGAVTERESETLYDLLLREPTDNDWKYRPEETMAFLTTPHYEPMERWFAVALSRKAEEKAMNIAELIRRQRFFSTLPMGGRLVSLRWVLEAPDEALSKKGKQQKAAFLVRYPEYKDLSDQAVALEKQLEELPVFPDKESEDWLKQSQLLERLGELAAQQEKFLRAIALIRDPCELAFPKPLTIPEVQQRLKPGQVVVSFLKAGRIYYVMMLTSGNYSLESQIQVKVLDTKIIRLVKALNVGDKATVLDPDVFLDEKWKQIAREISQLIFSKTKPQAIDNMKEIIFVPDGKVWYLPMEVLQVGTSEESVNLSERVRVRYAPTATLAVPDERVAKRFRRSGLIAERNFIKDSADQITQGVADLQAAIPEIELIEKTFQGPSALLSATIDRLIVWHMSSEKTKGAFDFSPFQLDAGKPGSGLDSWIMLPWKGIDQMILSGVSSGIEGSTRARADGSELFLLTTAMMGSGTRTILISRWRVGGQTTLDLTREFALELGKTTATKAWQRSVELLKDSEIDNSAESRLREKVLDQPMTGKHPYFWSSYMLLDTGSEPTTDTPATDVQGTEDSGGK